MNYHQYTTEQYTQFLKAPFSSDYGISDEKIAKYFINYNNSYLQAAIKAWGMTKSNLISDLIPALKKRLGGAVIFLLITIEEGASLSNYINHWGRNTSDTMLGQAADDMSYIVGGYVADDPTGQHTYPNMLTTKYPVNVSAPEVPWQIQWDSENLGQTVYDSLPNESIGRYYMVATMAGNAWAFGNNFTSTQYAYFGNPYDNIINAIKALGGNPFDASSGNTPTQGDGAPEVNNPDEDKSTVSDTLKNTIEGALAFIESLLKTDAYNNDSNNYSNNNLTITKLYNNLLRVRLLPGKLSDYLNGLNYSKTGGLPSGNSPKAGTPAEDSVATGTKNGNSNVNTLMANYAAKNVGKSLDFDGYFGAQCVDLITSMNRDLNLGLPLSGGTAYSIYMANKTAPSSWTFKDVVNDQTDFKNAPVGSILWFANSGYSTPGHVAIKASDTWMDVYNQNYGVPYAQAITVGGPDIRANLSAFVAAGNPFVGIWYKN